ncbi:MAG TPA: TlpA disulfide reductase family protein [Mucilaginibacter sp.]|jgi:thiol-disulfide isomerase/thioredoxin
MKFLPGIKNLKRYWRYFVLIYLSFFLCSKGFCQRTEVTLTKTIGHIPMFTASILPTDVDSGNLKLPAGIKLKYYNRYYTYLAPIEDYYRKYKSGEINHNAFLAKVKSVNRYAYIDTDKLANNISKYASSKINYISGIDTTGNHVILVDANQDGVISNNEILIYSPAQIDSLTNNPGVAEKLRNTLLSQVANDGTVRSVNVKINPVSFGTRNEPNASRDTTDFLLIRNEFWVGDILINDQSLTIYAQPKSFYNEVNNLQFRIRCNGKDDYIFFDIGDYWNNDKISLSIDSVSVISSEKIKLFISYQSPPRKFNDTTFTMSLQNVANDRIETLGSFLHKRKYILIDYWGTWCVPCIEKIPALKEIQQRFSDKLSIISIAYDFDIKKVADFDITHQLVWSSYFIDRNIEKNLTKPLKVLLYPTYRLYDESGDLIFSGKGDPDRDIDSIIRILSR